MMKLLCTVVGFLSCAVAVAGCNADDRCGEGTVEVDGACVPEGGGGECGPGTIEQDGECVPDGSVICETGTTFDAETGTCVPDITGCAEGTILVEGECVPEGEVREADLEEAAEPNDGLLANDDFAQFELPAVGESTLLHGCITPYRDVLDSDGNEVPDGDGEQDADVDAFVFAATEPTLLTITVDGVGGAVGGFQMLALDDPLDDDGWARFGINLTGDTAQQQVFLPVAGNYLFLAADSRSLLTALASGDADTCYYATIENSPIEPQPFDGEATGTLGGDVQFWSYDPQTDGEVISSSIEYTSASAAAGLVEMVNGDYRGSTPFGAIGAPASANLASLSADDEVLLVVEPLANFSITPVATTLSVTRIPTTALATDGSPVTLTHDDENPVNLVYFQGNAGDLVRLQFAGGGTGYDMAVYPPSVTDFDFFSNQWVSDFCLDASCADVDVWVQLQETGYYYFNVSNLDAADGDSYDFAVTLTSDTPAALDLVQPNPGSLVDQDRDFFEGTIVDGLTWLEYTVAPTSFTRARVRFYARGQAGELGELVLPVDGGVSESGEPFGRIVDGIEGTFLISIDALDGDGDETFDFTVSLKDFTDAGIVDDGSPVSVDDIALAAGEPTFVFLRGGSSDSVRVTAAGDGGVDLTLEQIDRTEAPLFARDLTGAGGGESFARVVGADSFIAMRVTAAGGAAGTFDLDAEVTDLTETTGTSEPAVAIPDDDPDGIDDVIALADTCTVAGVTVDVVITHAFRGDVALTLTSPSGTSVLLKASGTDSEDDVVGQFPTTLTPAESLDAFLAEGATGDWTLNAADTVFVDAGTLNSWGLTVSCM